MVSGFEDGCKNQLRDLGEYLKFKRNKNFSL